MSDRRYIILTVEDAKIISYALTMGGPIVDRRAIVDRLKSDTGGDIEEIVEGLKRLPICAACGIEGQATSCNSLEANKLGRRLNRLVQRARGEHS